MAMTDAQVLQKLREIPKPTPAGGGGPARAPAAGASRARRSDVEVAQAILAIELALSSPAVKAVLAGGGAAPAPKRAATKAAAAPPAGASAVSAGSSFCQIYAEVKPYIDIALEALEWVPYGSTVAKVVRLLEKFADQACHP